MGIANRGRISIFFQNGGIRNFVVVGLRNLSKELLFANFGGIGNLYSKMVKFAKLGVDLGTKYLKPNKTSYKICLLFFEDGKDLRSQYC